MSAAGVPGDEPRISELDIVRIYRGLPRVQPGAELEHRILQAARDARTKGRACPWRWQRPLAMAATVILCVGLVSFFYLEPGVMPDATGSRPEIATRALTESPPESRRMPYRLAAPRPAAGRTDTLPRVRQVAPEVKKMSKPGALERQVRQQPRRPGGADPGELLRQLPDAGAQARPALDRALERVRPEPATAGKAAAQTARSGSAEAMLARIRGLRDSGRTEAASRLWREFQRRYPDYPRSGIEAILGRDWSMPQ